MDSRIKAHLELVRNEFCDVVVGSNHEHFILPKFELPPNLFNIQVTRLLVVIPPTYPTAAPDNFYVTWGLALQAGGAINNYSGPTLLFNEQWGTFSFHVLDGGWNPERDSFLTFLTAVRSRLQEGA